MELDFTMIGMFKHADTAVKAVILILLFASFWCWGIIFEKMFLMGKLNRKAAQFEDSFWGGRSLESLYERVAGSAGDPMSATFVAAMKEWRVGANRAMTGTGELRAGLQARIERVMDIVISREIDNAERRMTFLATVGATAPFIGLLGTVWGIMNSFAAIAETSETSLAVVAPGIAEALFATAIGLFAAIPAVIAYNKYSSDISRYGERLDGFAGELSAILSRHMDDREDVASEGQSL